MTYAVYSIKKTTSLVASFAIIFAGCVAYANIAQAAPLFEEPVNYEIAAFNDLEVEDWGGEVLDSVAADLNGDGFVDIAVTYRDVGTPSTDYDTPAGREGVAILLNEGDSTYGISSYIPYEENLIAIASADFDGDGDIDLAVINNGVDAIAIMANDGNGEFVIAEEIETGLIPEKISFADFDGDGDIDLAASSYDVTRSYSTTGNPGVQIFLNDGGANFTPGSVILVSSSEYTSITDFTAADLDSDGDTDIVAGSGGGVAILLVAHNDGTGTFTTSETTILEPSNDDAPEFRGITVADFDGDLDVDIAATFDGVFPLSITTLLNDGAGIFSVGTLVSDVQADNIVVTDFDSDGDTDLLATNSGVNEVYLLDNDGLGSFTVETVTTLAFGGFTSINATDLNNDGNKDIVVSAATEYGVWVALQVNSIEDTPAEQAAALVSDVLALDIPNNLENSYLANLFKVEGFIESGQITPAINQLTAFINKVNQDYNKGKLSQVDRDNLVAAAQQLIDSLSN